MIKNAVISTREELMMANTSLYAEFLNNYDVDNSIRPFIKGNGGGISSPTLEVKITERPTCTPVNPTVKPITPTSTPTVRPFRPIEPFPELVIGYIIKDKPTLDWDVFKTYDIPDSNQYVEYDSYTYTFKKFDKLENATTYWTEFLQDKTILDNSIKRLEQKKSNKIWDFYSYNIDNSYISKLYDEMYMSFTNVRRYNEISQNIIKSFDQYTEKTDLIAFEFEGLSEFETNIIETGGSTDVTKGKLSIHVKHKKLKNIDYYVTATNGTHVDYDGTIYFVNNNVSYVTAYLSADPSVYKTVALKPSQLVKIPGEQDLTKTKEISACLKSYNAHRMLRPLSLYTTSLLFDETYNESLILHHSDWNLMDEFGHYDDYQCRIEFNTGGNYEVCTKAEPIVRTAQFNSLHISVANRMYIHGSVDVIDDTHIRLYLTALDVTAQLFNSSEASYRITIFKYKRDNNNKIISDTEEELITFDAKLSCKRLYPTGALRPKIRLMDPLNFESSLSADNDKNKNNNFSQTFKASQNTIITVTSKDTLSKLVSLSIEPANGNATALVPKVKRDGDAFKIYCVGKGSYKINYSLYHESDNYIDDTDNYSIIVSDYPYIVNKDFDSLKDDTVLGVNTYAEQIKEDSSIKKMGVTCSLNVFENENIIPASIIGQFNTFNEDSRTNTSSFATESEIDYIYTDYDYSQLNDGKLMFTVWYRCTKEYSNVSPLRIYFVNIDNSIIYFDYNPKIAQSFKVSRAFMFFGLIDDFTDYGKDLTQELYAISKQNKISGFIKVSLGLSDKPWTSSLVKEVVRPIYDPFITNLQNKYIAKFTATQVSYINRLRKTTQNLSLQNEKITNYLASQNLTSTYTSHVLFNNKLSYIEKIDAQKQISNAYIFNTAALGLSVIEEDNDVLSPWNVSPQITIDNPTVYYNLNEYYGKVRKGCMYKTTEKNYDLDISKNPKFDTDLDSVGITITISKTDQIKVEFTFEQIYAMINGKKENIYCIDKNSLKIAGTIDGKRVELKYVNGCSWNKTTGKVTISEDKSFNLVFGILNSRKRINLTFVVDEYYQVLDDIVIEDYDVYCGDGSPLNNLGGLAFKDSSYLLDIKNDPANNDKNIKNIKNTIKADKYAYAHVWVNSSYLSGVERIVSNLIVGSAKVQSSNTSSSEEGISAQEDKPSIAYFGTLSLRDNNLIFEKNYVLENPSVAKIIQPMRLPFRYVSDENIKWLVSGARQLNILEDHDYDICLNLSSANGGFDNFKTSAYSIRILCKNRLILIASDVNKYSSFTFNYKKNYDKYGFITALCIFDANDNLVQTYMLNTSFFPYTKATIVLERIHQTPIYYYNDALSEYKENGDYDNLLPSFTFYKDKVDQKFTCSQISSYCNSYVGLISIMPLRYKDNFRTLMDNMSISVLNNKVCAIQQLENLAISNVIITGSKPDNLNKTKSVSISNVLKIDGIKTEGKAVTKHIPDTIQYIGYLMYYYNMLYLRDLGWVMNDDCDSEDMIYYMIMLDKLKHQSVTFSKFREKLFVDGKAKYGNQIDIYDTDLASKLDWKTTIGYVEYFNKFKSNILKYWEDRIDAYNILEEVLGAYDSRLTVVEQIDKYLDILGDDGTKRKKIYFILTTENGEDKWAVSQINNRIYQQDALYYIWSNVYQIMFDGVFDFDLINDAIIRDIYNYGLFPEIEIPEMDNDGFFVPYKVNRNGKIEKSTNGWDGSGDEKYKYILDENNFIIGIDADIDLPENEQKARYWEFSQISDFNGWGSYEIVGADKDGWGKLMKDGKEYILTIKGKIVERKKRTNSTDVYHSKFGFLRNGKQYIRYRRRLDNKAPQSVHATYFGDCKEYWLDENKSNIIKTNKRSLITGIRLQRFLCELFISELNKTTYMVDVIQKFFEINNALGRLKTDWREILNKKLKKDNNTEENKIDVFTQEIKYPLVDFNLKEFSFEHKCIYPEDRTLQGVLSYTFNYYCWDDHKIKEEDGAEYMNIDIPEYSLQRQIVHESQIYDDYFSLSITIPQNIGIYRKGIGKFNFTTTYIVFDGNESELTYISTYSISDSTYHSNIKGVLVKPAISTGIEPFIIYPWNINKNNSTIIDSDDNNDNISYTNLYEPVCWSSTIADLSGLPNYSDYDRLSRYVDVDTSGLRNTEVIMAKIKSGELKDAPAAELCYNYDGGEFVKVKTSNNDKSYIIENKLQKNRLISYTYTITYSYGINYSNSFSYYNMWAYNSISSPKLKPVTYVSDAELSKYPLCEYSVSETTPIYNNQTEKRVIGSEIVATYTYKYIAPNITYQITASYIKNNYQTVISYYNKYHLKYKEETQLGPDNTSFPIPKSTKVSQASEETHEIAAFSMRAPAESFQDNRTTLYMTVNRLDELMMYDDGISNVGRGGGGRINASTTKIYATLKPTLDPTITIELTIPPIITRPVPTIKPTLLPKPTIVISVEPTIRPIITSSPIDIPTIVPSEELKKSVFSEETINDIITNASIKRVYRIYQNGNAYSPSYLYKSDDLIKYSSDEQKNARRKFFTDAILSKFIGIENGNVGDEIITSYINSYIMKYGFKDLVLGVTYYNSNGFVEYEIKNDYEIIDEAKDKRDYLRDTFGFYLGSVSQWQIVQDNVKRINTELYKINKELKKLSYTYTKTYNLYPEVDYFYEGKYADNKYCNRLFWTSSEIDKDEAWPMFFDQYYCGLNNKLTSAYVRPFMTYKEPTTQTQSEEPQLSRVTSVETK